MAFELYQDDIYTSPQLDYVTATAGESYEPGELLKIGAAGTATKAGGTDMPVYLCNCAKSAAAEGEQLQVVRLQKTHKLRATLSADGAALKAGDKVTLSDDGMQATATTAGGVLEIVEVVSGAAGGEIIVRV